MTPFKHILMTFIVVSCGGKELRKDNTNTSRRIKDERNDTQKNIQTDRQTDRLDSGQTDGWNGIDRFIE